MKRRVGTFVFAGFASAMLGAACGGPFEGDGCALATASEPCTPGKCLRVWCPQPFGDGAPECYDSIEMDLESFRAVVVAMRGRGHYARPRRAVSTGVFFESSSGWVGSLPFSSGFEVCETSLDFQDEPHDGRIGWWERFGG